MRLAAGGRRPEDSRMLRVLRSCLLPSLAATLLCALAHAATPGNSSSKATVTYRWVDDQGMVHYGDQIPAQYATKDREVLNNQGVPIRHLDAQKTPAQLAEEAQAREALIKQKQHDSFLITTYTSVKDIEALRDARLEQLNVQRAAAQQYVDSLRSRLGTLQTRALNFRPYSDRRDAPRMPDDLAENLVRTLEEMRQQTSALAAKAGEETELRAEFQADIERYKELHTIHSQ
jgi:hypothetical protein